MSSCCVRGCAENATEVVELRPDLDIRLQWACCSFHAAALKAGESWSFADDTRREIVLGSDGPLEVINFLGHRDLSGRTIELVLGHDGVETQRVTVRMSKARAQSICRWVADSDHPEVFE